jgi:hypothetical protein
MHTALQSLGGLPRLGIRILRDAQESCETLKTDFQSWQYRSVSAFGGTSLAEESHNRRLPLQKGDSSGALKSPRA